MMSKLEKFVFRGWTASAVSFILFITGCSSAISPASTPPVVDEHPPGLVDMVTFETLPLTDDVTLTYALYLPPNFEPTQIYPVLVAFPPGGQSRDLVAWGLTNYWQSGARENGWIVASPVAPNGQLFFRGSEQHIPAFLAFLGEKFRVEGGKFHFGGVSNGGLSAFRTALNQPELVRSILVLPGFPPTAGDMEKLPLLADTGSEVSVRMYVGEQDSGWVAPMTEAQALLTDLGVPVTLEIVPDEGHVIQSLLGGEALYAFLEAVR